MKRTTFLIGTLCLLVFGFTKANANVLSNVIAISSTDEMLVECYNTITTHESKMVRYCGSCSFVPGDNALFSGKSKCDPTSSSQNPDIQ